MMQPTEEVGSDRPDIDSDRRVANLGCGTDIREGATNVDLIAIPGIDVVASLDGGDLPFRSEVFNQILARDVLEHLDALGPAMSEIGRVLKPGGRLSVQVPHFTSSGVATDPTHKRGFSVDTFDFFLADGPRSYYGFGAFSKVVSVRIDFEKSRLLPWNSLLQRLVNRSSMAQHLYERSPLRVFPAMNIVCELER